MAHSPPHAVGGAPCGRRCAAYFAGVLVLTYLIVGGGLKATLSSMAWTPTTTNAVVILGEHTRLNFEFPAASADAAAQKCGASAEIDTSRKPDTLGDTCPTGDDAVAGCSRCTQRLPHSFDVADPFHLGEFKANPRGETRNFVPILRALEDQVAKVDAAKRLVLDVGFTQYSDVEWMTNLYASAPGGKATQFTLFEPNPVTAAAVTQHVADLRLPVGAHFDVVEKGVGNQNSDALFWLNKDGSRSSFQRVRSDDYEQIPQVREVAQLDVLYPDLQDTVIPFVKMSAGRWEHPALLGGLRTLRNNAAVVMADISPLPNNSRIVQTLADAGFTVYALGCGTLARIHQDRPWWWSPVIAVKPFLVPVAESFVCWDFSRTDLVCDEPHAATIPPVGCRSAAAPPSKQATLPRDMDPVESTKHASPAVHRTLTYVFLSVTFATFGTFGYFVVWPMVQMVMKNGLPSFA